MAGNPEPAMVEPVFFKQKDFGENLSTSPLKAYEVCMAVSRIIGQGNVDGAQNINGIWRIYLHSKESRINLLVRGHLTLMGRQVQLFDKNPTLVKDPSEPIERVTIKDLPLSVSNTEVDSFLVSKGLVPISAVKYTRARDEAGGLTSFRTGDRFVYVKGPISPILPKKATIADFMCRTYHDGQFKPNCQVCNMAGHSPGDSCCASRNTGQTIIAFHSHKNIFSNFYPCQIEVDGVSFPSVEHGYQWYQAKDAGLEDLADQIINAPHAGIAKKLSKRIPQEFRENWEKINIDKMNTLLMAKVAQVPAFEAGLIESNGSILAESTPDRFWASGLSSDVTEKTNPQTWPGLNKLGTLLMEIRQELLTDRYKVSEDNTSALSHLDEEEDTDGKFFNTHEEDIFTDEVTSVDMTESASVLSIDSAKSTKTRVVGKTSCEDSAPSSSNVKTAGEPVKTQTKLRQKKLTETDKAKNSSEGKKKNSKQAQSMKTHEKQGEKRKPSRTPEKEKMSKLMKVFTKK